MSASEIRVLIADDHPIVCAGIRQLLEAADGVAVIGEAHTGQEALDIIESQPPDVVLLDMELPDMTGVDVLRKIIGSGSVTRVLGLSSHDDRQFITELISLGAAGYLLKDEVPEQIIEAVRGVANGETGWVSRKVAAKLSQMMQQDRDGGAVLSPRELDVLRLVVDAKTNSEIAHKLGISEKTVEKHLETMFRKLGVVSRVEAAVMAVREKLL